jgi:hypothetical protein
LQTGDSLGELKWRQSCIRMSRYLPTLAVLLIAGLALFRVLVAAQRHPRSPPACSCSSCC